MNLGEVMLIGIIAAYLGDCFLGNILEIFWEKVFNIYIYMYI